MAGHVRARQRPSPVSVCTDVFAAPVYAHLSRRPVSAKFGHKRLGKDIYKRLTNTSCVATLFLYDGPVLSIHLFDVPVNAYALHA